jgi:serine/threonine protein kinase
MAVSFEQENFKRLEKLGEGSYGVVFKVLEITTNKIMAMKEIKMNLYGEGISATTLREISILSALNNKEYGHQNIVKLLGIIYKPQSIFLLFNYFFCDLRVFLDNHPKNVFMDTILLKRFAYFLTEGIRYCHSRSILHRDLKPQNILISHTFQLKIADFGLAKQHQIPTNNLTADVLTLWYRSPEILLGHPIRQKYSGSCDVWSIACIFAEMVTKKVLFCGDSAIDQLFKIYQLFGTPNNATWPGVSELHNFNFRHPKWPKKNLMVHLNNFIDIDGIDLLEQAFTYSPHQRITAQQMLSHKWFDEIRATMINMYNNKYPHCGSKEYQQNVQAKKKEEKEEKEEEKDNDLAVVNNKNQKEEEEEEEEDNDLAVVNHNKNQKEEEEEEEEDNDLALLG